MSIKDRSDTEIFELAKILGQQTDFQEVVRLVATRSAQLLKADLSLLLMLNPDTRETVKTIFKDGKSIRQKEYRDVHIHVGGWIIDNRKPFFSGNLHDNESFTPGLFEKTIVNAVAGVPLLIEGIIIGALILVYKDSSEYNDPKLMESLEYLAAVSVPFLRNAQKIREYFTASLPNSSLLVKYNNAGLYGKSARFIELLHAIEAAAKADTRVLLIGKTGTGKELIARAIHNFSSRSEHPFIATDCGAIPETLLESEFFGHTKGAYTGAQAERKGLFLEANHGTLFMDEINNLPLNMQSKFLRVLEDHQIRPLGSNTIIEMNVRTIAASSAHLKDMVKEKLFREDLFYRLNAFPIYVPDLIERKGDIPLLAQKFLLEFSKQQNKEVNNFQDEVIDYLKQRTWEGNIRELKYFVERLVTLSSEDTSMIGFEIFPADLQPELIQFQRNYKPKTRIGSLKECVQEFEARLVKETLIECDWNQSETARQLKTTEKNIRYKMANLNITKP